MRRILLAILVLALLVTAAPWFTTPAEANNIPFTITNKTGYTAFYLYVAARNGSWGSDRLGDGVLRNGEKWHGRGVIGGQYKAKMVDEDGDSYTFNFTITSRNQNWNFDMGDMD